MIAHVAVLIPARDEQDRIGQCLTSVQAAIRHCSVEVSITVVADGCHDNTAAIARTFPDVQVVEMASSNVGAARLAAARHALGNVLDPALGYGPYPSLDPAQHTATHAAPHRPGIEPENVWLANTDADSIVPENWFAIQIGYADAGYDVVIGTVRPDPREFPEELQREWERTHLRGQPNGHVHGANLGVRASAYLGAGGYRRLPEHEDVDLVMRMNAYQQVASDEAEVITSARLVGRTSGGYAGHLRRTFQSRDLRVSTGRTVHETAAPRSPTPSSPGADT